MTMDWRGSAIRGGGRRGADRGDGAFTGGDLMQGVDERLARAEREARAVQEEADSLAARRDALRGEEAEALRELARMRLDALRRGADGGVVLERLDEAGRRARALIERGTQARTAFEAELAERQAALLAANAARDRAAARLDEAEAAAERALEETRARLAAADPEWRRRRDAAIEAAQVARHADRKAAFARRDREEKGRPYEADPLFLYLWRRGYGTPAYRAGPIARLLDGWVARVARYESARRSYALLTELPERLAEHAARMRDAAEAAAADLAEYERAAAAGAATVPEALRQALERAEDAVEAAHAALEETERRRAALTAGEDAATRGAVAALEAALAHASVRELREAAARTPTPQDDAVVARMERAAAERAEVERRLGERRTEAEAARRRVEELLAIRQEMRRRGYAQDRWSFGDGALVGMLLSELLRGALSRDGFWDRMDQHRIPQGGGASPGGTGGGSFGGRGGFRTGGTIRGGGFRTGGSF
ncbi:coiled-coil domain-containing protein [Caldovatus sediminis]|nr:hypothetical protein [Caldovatus sediminis]